MTAREKFTVSQRVQLTAAGQALGLAKRRSAVPPDTGIVRGFSRDARLVRVQIDGRKTVSTYHADFWEPIQEKNNGRGRQHD